VCLPRNSAEKYMEKGKKARVNKPGLESRKPVKAGGKLDRRAASRTMTEKTSGFLWNDGES